MTFTLIFCSLKLQACEGVFHTFNTLEIWLGAMLKKKSGNNLGEKAKEKFGYTKILLIIIKIEEFYILNIKSK